MFGEVDYVNQVLSTLFEAIGRALPGIMAGLAIFVAFLIAASLVRRIFDRLARGVEEHRRPLVGLAAQTARYVIITAGLITALGTMGIDVSALIAGLGRTGFALGYACRDALSNLLAGVLIILYQPFKPGQTITVSGKTGRVESVNFRYTELSAEGKAVLVPNSAVFGSVIIVEESCSGA